jgi:hypothetical protein
MFIPPVRNGVNNLVKGGSQKEPAKPRQETAGLGEVKTIKFK